eukprot:5499871-Amphidinium_carterae.1
MLFGERQQSTFGRSVPTFAETTSCTVPTNTLHTETQKQWIQMDAERTFMGQLSSQSGMIEIDASDGCSSSNTTAQVSQI